MHKKSILSMAMLALCSSAAFADGDSRWYAGATLGASKGKDFTTYRQLSVNGNPIGSASKQDVEMGGDTSYLLITGYRFNDQWSIQGEWSRRSYESDSVINNGTRITQNDVRLKSDAMMVNAIYTLQGWGGIRPYIGLGMGASHIKFHKDDTLNGADDTAWVFASQALLGAEYSLSRDWTLFGQYQYFRSANFDLSAQSSRGAQAFKYDAESHQADQTLSIGVRYNF